MTFLALIWCGPVAAEDWMRVRIEFGGGGEGLWEGSVAVEGLGQIDDPRPLGIEADEPGSMWLEDGRLIIRQRSVRTYDGVDLSVNYHSDSKLLIRLTTPGSPDKPIQVDLSPGELAGGYFQKDLDAKGNRLLVRRAPGDYLKIDFARDMLVFSPGEHFRFTVEPHLLPLPSGTKVRLKVRLVGASIEEQLLAEHDVRVGQPVAIPVDVNLPQAEGAYDVKVVATRTPGWSEAVRKPLNWKKTVARRKMQLLVLGPQQPVVSPKTDQQLRQIVEIDPANPRWWERLPKLPRLSRMREIPLLVKGPLGNENAKTIQHPLGKLVRLNPSRQSPDVSWEAYTLPIDAPDRPHILEVDFPSDVPQTLGISVLEPNAAGALMPIGLDSGVDSRPEEIGGNAAPRWQRHRLIFWPRTRQPMVLLTNLRDRQPAVYGKIRVLGGWEHLPQAQHTGEPRQGERLWAAYFDRPLFPENFSAEGSLGEWIGRSLHDWRTFHQGGTRLVEYLQYVGYNGMMISVLADGSTIYPSRVLQPTPRYDTGTFLSTGQDPVRKDVLEMLLRLFDRRQLQLIPMIEFAAPLPRLEAILRKGGPQSRGIEWIGPDGKTWCQKEPARRGLAPYYNMLDPRVQESMLEVARELIGRYAHHPSFAGLAVRLSANGYAQLPGPDWGMDDATIARFEKDAKLKVPGSGPARFVQRASFLNGDKHRGKWLQWRAAELARFYRRMHGELAAIRPGGRLYLAGAGALSEDRLRPVLPRRTTVADALLQVGIDAQHYRNDAQPDGGGPVLLRPERIHSTGDLRARATSLEIKQYSDFDEYFRGLHTPGNLFFHQPREVRVASFDRKSPFDPTYTSLVCQPVSAGQRCRRRFVHALATFDSQVLVDGGWMLALGQEESIRHLVATYRRLPAVNFERVDPPQGANSSQPVTFRHAAHAGQTYLYAVNDAPFAVTARVGVNAPAGCRIDELTGRRRVASFGRDGQGTYWAVQLQPYDVVAVKLTHPEVKFFRPKASFANGIETVLKQRIQQLGARAASLRGLPPALKLLQNPGFESRPDNDQPVPGWLLTKGAGISIITDESQQHGGRRSARLTTDNGWACLVSRPFDPPATGRLTISAWLRVADPAKQPSLHMALQGNLNGKPYYRHADVGRAAAAGQAGAPIGREWAQYVFPINDLPMEGLGQLQVRFDLSGPGEVWVDDVELFDLAFSNNELKELYKLITLADVMLQNGRVGDLMRLLEGYWPRFLEENVPLPVANTGVAQKRNPEPPPPKKPPRTGFVDGLRNLLPESLRF